MKILRLVNVAILCLVLFSFFPAGCDKDKSPTKPGKDTALVGIWKIIKITWEFPDGTSSYNESQLNEGGWIWTVEIREDGTYESTCNMADMSVWSPPITSTGTWSTSANQFMSTTIFQGNSITQVFKFTIDGNILKLTNESPTGDSRIISEFRKQ